MRTLIPKISAALVGGALRVGVSLASGRHVSRSGLAGRPLAVSSWPRADLDG